MDVKNICEWCGEFAAGRTEIHNQIVCENWQIPMDGIRILVLQISRSTIQKILVKVQYWKVCARWVLRMLIADH